MELFVFTAGDKHLGMEARFIHRIIEGVSVAPAPFMPPFYLGLIHYRGELFDVIHMAGLMGEKSESRDRARLMLIKWSQRKLALVPDRIVGMTWIDDGPEIPKTWLHGEKAVEILTPDYIWNRLTGFSHGPDQV